MNNKEQDKEESYRDSVNTLRNNEIRGVLVCVFYECTYVCIYVSMNL